MAGDDHDQTPKAARNDDDTELARLPDDVLADVLRHVPPRWLAAARCVCKTWRHTVDSRRLLRSDLLPLSLAGIFIHYERHKYPEYLARPSSTASGARAVSGDLSFLPSASPECGYFWQKGRDDFYQYSIQDHCNGLLLLTGNYVVNPATRRWHTLPTCPSDGVCYDEHLVYDPMQSPYYEVFKIPSLDDRSLVEELDPSTAGCEWPPSVCKMYVFSSKSGRWEEKDFIREGDAAGTVGEMQVHYSLLRSVYFRGVLYVHHYNDFLMRVPLTSNTYHMVKPPADLKEEGYMDTTIARSEKDVYFLALYKYWLRVWILNEFSGQTEWLLKHDKDLKPVLARHGFDQRVHARWILEDINYNLFCASHSPKDNNKPPSREILEWNSDNDDDVENEEIVGHCDSEDNKYLNGGLELLGFHPYKEIVFLSVSTQASGLAYHLNDSKVEGLGNIYPKEYYRFRELPNEPEGITCFPYTPCLIEEF